MFYKKYEELTLIEMAVDAESVSFEELERVLLERPSNVVYCETNGKLCGVISMGDIQRAAEQGKKEVLINRHFTRVTDKEYMRAREIFRENGKINALPIVNGEGVLLGDYSRWDDLLWLENNGFGGYEGLLKHWSRAGNSRAALCSL